MEEESHLAKETYHMTVSHSQFLPTMLDKQFTPMKGMSNLILSTRILSFLNKMLQKLFHCCEDCEEYLFQMLWLSFWPVL